MNVLICTRQVIFCDKGCKDKDNDNDKFYPGGLMRKIDNETEALKKRGHNVMHFNGWDTLDPNHIDVVYLVGASIYTESICREAISNDLRFAVAPVLDNFQNIGLLRLASLSARFNYLYTNPGAIRKICDKADVVCVASSAEMVNISRGFNIHKRKIRIVPNYINVKEEYLSQTKEMFVETYGLNDFLLCVGAIGNPRKNFYRLIKIAGKLGIETVIIGPDFDKGYADLCRREASKYRNIHVIGCVSNEMLWSAYAAADTLILPSYNETTGFVALEAALMNTNIIATKVGGPSYYLQDYAEYINPRSDKSIAKAICNVFGKSKKKGLRKHIIENFNIDTAGLALEEALIASINVN
jgi:glycosyltransferase involved in cell wall biosynthesis